MEENMIRWGIIGAGNVAEMKSGPAFNKAEHSELLAVMRRNPEKAEDFANRHGVPLWYSDSDELLKNPDINAVYIATPPSSHKDLTIRALQAGKNVYLEKPMCLNTEECSQIITELKKSRQKLVIAHYRRYLPAFRKVEELILSGAIGDPRIAHIRIFQPADSNLIAQSEEDWRTRPEISGGGLFHDIAPHQIDLMLCYFGPVQKAEGFSCNQAGLTPADDLVTGRIQFENGTIFDGLWSFSIDSERNREEVCEIYGSHGKIRFSFYGDRVFLTSERDEKIFNFINPENIQLPMISKTVSYFRGEGKNPCSAEEGLESIRIMEAFS